jgi:sulfur carrier protein ThiS adenylyltransferase
MTKMKFSEINAHLGKFRVGIAGAGGLGSNCAVALARSGVGTLVISDFDIVEGSNLNRQYYFTDQIGMMKTEALKKNLARINPEVLVIAHQQKISTKNIAEIFSGCDVIVEAFDSSDMKQMLLETARHDLPGIPVIIASGLAGWGNTALIGARKIDDTLYICGDESSEVSEELPPMAPRVGIVANMQANLVVELLMRLK